MKMRITFIIEEGEAALKQVAACVGFANQLGVGITMTPEDDPKKRDVRWKPGGDVQVRAEDKAAYKEAGKLLGWGKDDGVVNRMDFVRALAKAIKKHPKTSGLVVKRWIEEGVMEEV